MDTTIGTSQTTITFTTNATASLQRYYFTRFVSNPLSGISSITAQTWTYNFAVSEVNNAANFPVSGTSQPVRVMAYVWRPSTQSKVGDILDGNSASTVSEPATTNSERSEHTTFTGSSVASVQDGDVICFEVWFEITELVAVAYACTFYFDGTTVTTSVGTVVSNHASFLETPQNLTFGSAVFNSRLFFHAANSGLSNLPTTTQSALSANKSVDATTVNRSMDTTIGTSQTSLVLTSNATTSSQNYYYSRFVSDALSISSIAAGDWVYSFSTAESSTSANFPVSVGPTAVRITCYVWRPGTQTKTATIYEGNSTSTVDEPGAAAQWAHYTTFTGAAVASVQSGDVIIFEVWFIIQQAAGSALTDTFYYDGTTITNTPDTVVTNHTSYLEVPQSLVSAAPIDCTVTGKTIYNKTTRHG